MKNLLPFEKKVLLGLKSCGVPVDSVSAGCPLGAAVSGGADSVSLLLSLYAIFGSEKLRVITINHGIRSEKESGGDAAFVEGLCETYKIPCVVSKIPHGKILKIASETKKSVEEVARKLRYEAFYSFIDKENLAFLCLAHNQNDQIETLLMRFLQGSGTEGMGGIDSVRGKIVRPLLLLSRNEIESYLSQKNQSWRTDSTNFDTKYLRNKIRNVLIPFLNENFDGWSRAVISGAKKTRCDELFLESCCPVNQYDSKINRDFFYSLHDSLKRRVFFSTLNRSGFGNRFPFKLFEEILSWKNQENRILTYENLTVALDGENLAFIFAEKSSKNEEIETGFSFFVNNEKDLCDSIENLNMDIKDFPPFKINFPCLLRSYIAGDKIKTSDGNYKSLSKIFSDWKIPENLREKVPVVEEICSERKETSQIKAVIAEPFGFKNWIVE